MRGPGAWESEASLHTSYLLNGQKLSVVKKQKHLGFVISSKLSWSIIMDIMYGVPTMILKTSS